MCVVAEDKSVLNDVDFKVQVSTHIASISSDLKHLVQGNDRQDKALEETKAEMKEIKQDIKLHKSFLDKALGILLMLVFLVPAFEAFVVYKSLSNDVNTASRPAEIRQH